MKVTATQSYELELFGEKRQYTKEQLIDFLKNKGLQIIEAVCRHDASLSKRENDNISIEKLQDADKESKELIIRLINNDYESLFEEVKKPDWMPVEDKTYDTFIRIITELADKHENDLDNVVKDSFLYKLYLNSK